MYVCMYVSLLDDVCLRLYIPNWPKRREATCGYYIMHTYKQDYVESFGNTHTYMRCPNVYICKSLGLHGVLYYTETCMYVGVRRDSSTRLVDGQYSCIKPMDVRVLDFSLPNPIYNGAPIYQNCPFCTIPAKSA